MRTLLLLTACLIALPLPAAAAQERPGPSPEKAFSSGLAVEDIQGCWRLVSITLDGLPDNDARGAGVLLIDGPYIAFEMHRTWSGAGLEHRIHQSYLGDYRLVDGAEIHIRRLIGSYLDELTGELEWIAEGDPLLHRIHIEDERLVLEANQRDRMVFARVQNTLPGERDIFGRAREGSARSDVDIFGRKRAGADRDEEAQEEDDASTGKRDIFGRRRKKADDRRAPHEGIWRMNSIQLDGLPRDGDSGPGYLLLTDGFAVLAVHRTWTERGAPLDVHQTIVAEYRIVNDTTLQLRTIVGSRLNIANGQLLVEGPSVERTYRMFDGGDTLALHFDTDNRMNFTRFNQRGNHGTDIFGRKLDTGATSQETDIFGRPKKKEKKER